MNLFGRLSLRKKFLVTPAIGFILIMLFASLFGLGVSLQNERIRYLETEELTAAKKLIELFADLSTNHAKIYELLISNTPQRDDETLLTIGKPYLYEIYRLENQSHEEGLIELLHDAEVVEFQQLMEELKAYRIEVALAFDAITLDHQRSVQHMNRATQHYIIVEEKLLSLMGVVRSNVALHFKELRSDALMGTSLLFLFGVVSVLFMIVVAAYLSQRLSQDLRTMIGVMGRMAAGEHKIEVPQVTSSKEVDEMAIALLRFRESLQQLDDATEAALVVNIALEEEISERKRAEEELRLTSSVFEHSLEGIMITDPDGVILRVNQAFTDITGYTDDEVLGLKPNILRSDRHDEAFYRALWLAIIHEGKWNGEIWNRRKNGEVYPEWRNVSAVTDEDGNIIRYISIFTDITDKKLSEEHIHRLAHYDALTDLPNRAMFQERLGQALILARRHKKRVAVLFLDLDRFKLVNDSLGHAVGDNLLIEVGARLVQCVREGDTVARLGGDEFTVILQELQTAEDAALVAQKILAALSVPFECASHEIYTTASVGVSIYPDDGSDTATLLKNADAAMYKAKEQGKNTYRFFTEEINTAALERMKLENSLRAAIQQQEFMLYYQPRVDGLHGEIIGMEALIRWNHPQFGMVPPNSFIPIAEETGLIIPLGRWVFQEACRQYMQWREEGVAPSKISINISGRQFLDSRLLEDIAETLEETGMDPRLVELELTESFLMEDPKQSISTLEALKSMGFHLSVDDFGTAYSSLSYLKRFPIDTLKIDGSFVQDIPHDQDDITITKTIIAMAVNMGLSVIAEGVETRAQLDFLVEHGCYEVQGYYFSRPLPVATLAPLLKQRRPFDQTVVSKANA